MSQGNDKDNSAAVVIGFIVAGMMALAMIIFAIAAFLAFVMTILSVIAWNNPLRIGKWTIEPEEARAFVFRGLFGASIVPLFIVFCQLMFNIYIRWDL